MKRRILLFFAVLALAMAMTLGYAVMRLAENPCRMLDVFSRESLSRAQELMSADERDLLVDLCPQTFEKK